jgi:5-methylcytosine-specific restriction protein A
MLISVADADGHPLDAKVELSDGAVILHSRGGAYGKPNLRNPDYRKALRVILERLGESGQTFSGVWLDSRVALTWPVSDRRLLEAAELTQPVDRLVTLIGQRAAAKGRREDSTGHGNSTKRIRIDVPGASAEQLQLLLGAPAGGGDRRLPAGTLSLVKPWMIDDAISALMSGAEHHFQASTDYDLLLPSGERLPPKAVFGIALSKVLSRPAKPSDFSAGPGQPCFDIIENAGYPIVRREEAASPPDTDDERSWAEGSVRRTTHLRRERAPGLAQMKKRYFVAEHGRLFCERCNLIPSEALGQLGDACIEVHHYKVSVSDMGPDSRTRLADLQCLCANCHRIVHREQL